MIIVVPEIKNAVPSTQNGLLIPARRPREAGTRAKRIVMCPQKARRQVKAFLDEWRDDSVEGIAGAGNKRASGRDDRWRAGRIVNLRNKSGNTVELFARLRRTGKDVVAQTQIEGEIRLHLPVVLKIRCSRRRLLHH